MVYLFTFQSVSKVNTGHSGRYNKIVKAKDVHPEPAATKAGLDMDR